MLKSPRILIIEDDITLLVAYSNVFAVEGFELRAALNGKEALKIAKEFVPDVILLDMLMPIMDGRGFLKGLKGNAKVIVFSNIDEMPAITDSRVKYYLQKSSFTPREIVKVVKQVLES